MPPSQEDNRKDAEAELFRLLVENVTDYAVFVVDRQGRVQSWNPGAERLIGYTEEEIVGRPCEIFFTPEDVQAGIPEREMQDALVSGRANDDRWHVRKDGSRFWSGGMMTPLRQEDGSVRGFAKIMRDRTEWKHRTEDAAVQSRIAAFNKDVSHALVQTDTLPDMLHHCAEAMVRHLEAAFARIWTLNTSDNVLELQASAGMYTHLNGPHSRVPVGRYKIGMIAQERRPHLTNTVVGDPRVSNQDWAKQNGMTAFAGYPLIVEERVVGVMAMFARQSLNEATLNAMSVVANGIAVGIERKIAEEQRQAHQEWLAVTLASIGDAVIATDTDGRVKFLNHVAEQLTGWTQHEAHGRPLEVVFEIQHEQTRQPVENPVAKVLKAGRVVGLGNHTVLLSKDGTIRPIDDSAAPIRDETGKLIGVVLVFRDVTEHRQAENEVHQSEARKRAIVETALDCIITMDHAGTVVEFNPAAETTFGWHRRDIIGKNLADCLIPPLYREQHRLGLIRYLATGEGPVLGKRLELQALRADGSQFPVELAINRIPTEGPPLFTAYLRDISEPKRAERYRNTRLAVTHVLNQAPGVPDGARGVLKAVCENLGWDVGFFWKVNNENTAMACTAHWQTPELLIGEFEAASESSTFEKGVGLPGRVWAAGEPHWIPDLAQDNNFPRLAVALRCGLQSAFAIPIIISERTVGVIEFFSGQFRESDEDFLELMGSIAGNIGQFLERKGAEERLLEQTHIAQTLNRIGRILAAELDLEKIVQAVTEEGTKLTAAEFGALFYNVAGDRGESYMLYALSGVPREAFADFPMPRNTLIFSPTFLGERVVRLADVTKDPRFGQNAPYHGMPKGHLPVRSYLAVPVISRSGEVLGGLFFGHSQVGVFTERHERILVGVAAQAAMAIDNARLYQQTHDSDERFRQLADHIHDVFWMADPHTPEMLYISPAYEKLWGRSCQSLFDQPKSFLDAIHPHDHERVISALKRQVAGEPTSEEYRVVRPDGSVRWVWDRAFPVRDAAGRVYRIAGIAEDITERKHAEEASRFLAEASATLATVEDYESTLQRVAGLAVPGFADWCAVDLVEAEGSLRRLAVVHVDPEKVRLAAELHQKYPPHPNETHGAYRVFRTGEPEFVAEVADEVLVEAAQDEGHLRILRSLGLRSFIVVPLQTRNRILGILTFVYAESGRSYESRDLLLAAELARRAAIAIENSGLYHELKDADRRKDEFLATLAHELRNPLAPICNGLQVLRLTGSENTTVSDARSMMERQVTQMVRLVDDLLDVSRITRNKLDLRRQKVTLKAVIDSAVETSRPLIQQARHSFSQRIPPDPVYLDADLTRLAQVFSNLLNNSAKYTESGGHVSLEAEVTDAEVVVRVRDNGLGIPPEALPRLFQMFSQVERNMERAQGGLGIGLTLVRRLVELHGGTVEVQSDGPGCGSEFRVRLPVLTEDANDPKDRAAGDPSPTRSRNHRILIVDDNQDSALSLEMMLKLMGNETRTAHDGIAAVEAAAEFRPEIILLDIGLPKLNGYDVCRHIRQQSWSGNMVIVALTGWGQEEDRRRSAEAGFNHHMVKPVEIAILQKLLNESHTQHNDLP